MSTNKSVLFIFLISLCTLCNCIYEDQIGKFDWRQRYVGKVKFSSIDSKTLSKKIFVATDENVLAALSIKSGDIAWRQLFERGSQGKIQFMTVHNEVLTVSGTGPYVVRGWNSNAGFLHYEWIINNEKYGVVDLWSYHQSRLYHVSLNEQSPGVAEVTVYNAKIGLALDTYSIHVPDVKKNTNCKLIGLNLICVLDKGQLRGMSIIGIADSKILKYDDLHPGVPSSNDFCKLDLVESTIEHPAATVTCGNLKQMYTFSKDEITFNTNLPASSSVAVIPSSNNSYIKLTSTISNGELHLSGSIFDSGEAVNEVESTYEHTFQFSNFDILSSLCILRRDLSISCQLLLSCEDHSLIYIQTPGKILWTREEALSSIISVELLDLPVSDLDAAIEKEFNNKEGGFIGMFVRRIMSQILQARSFLITILSLGESTPSNGLLADLVRDQFGLHKIIVAVTSVGKIFGVDNWSGQIVWQTYLKDIKPFENLGKPLVPFYIQRTARHLPLPAQCFLLFKSKVTEESVAYIFNPINGQPLAEGLKPLGLKIVQSTLLHSTNEAFLKGVLLLDNEEKLHVYPESMKPVVIQNSKSTFLFTANPETGLIMGYSLVYSDLKNLVASLIWKVQLSNKITGIVSKSPIEKVHSQGRVLGDRSVLYKYINPNLVAVITQAEDPIHKNILTIHLIDVVSGSIVFSVAHKRAAEPIHLVHSENWVVYSYFHDKHRRTEINALEFYEGKIQSNTSAFSSLSNVIYPIVEKQSYILPSGIESMKETITEKGITSKHILVALNSGGILEIPWVFLDPRRPLGETREDGAIPYIPDLPIPTESIINYNQTLMRVNNIHTAPSGLESTCLVFVYGLDLFYVRVAPSKTFDVLKEDFDHLLISAVLLGLCIAAYTSKRLASKKALKQAWK